MGRSVDHRQRPGPWFGSGLASDRRRRHCFLPGHRRLDRSAVRGTGQRLRLRCACGVLAAPAIRRAGHRPIAEPGLALVRQPAGLAHCLDGDRSPVRLCLGPAREGAAHKTADHGGARITEARRFVPGSNSGIDSVPRSMDNRSRRPVDFRYMASARKAPLIDIAMSAMITELLDSKAESDDVGFGAELAWMSCQIERAFQFVEVLKKPPPIHQTEARLIRRYSGYLGRGRTHAAKAH